MKQLNIAVIGGDLRSSMLVKLLRADGHCVKAFGLETAEDVHCESTLREAVDGCELVVGPIPLSEDHQHIRTPFSQKVISFERLAAALRETGKKTVFIAGRTEALSALCPDITVVDFLAREDMAVLNAVPTAEGAMQLAMEKTPYTLHGSRCLILGYGRIGRVLADRLAHLGAHVSVAARKFSDIAWIRSIGCEAVRFTDLSEHLREADIIVNTVPCTVLGEEELDKVSRDCLIIDLASKPGGVDFKYAESLGLNVVWALSLPGKVAPVSAGRIMKETLYNIVEEMKYPWR